MKLGRIFLVLILLFLGMDLEAQLLPVANQSAPTPKALVASGCSAPKMHSDANA